MRADWLTGLDAAIAHLEDLKARGVRFVPVSPQTLAALGQPAPPSVTAPPTAVVRGSAEQPYTKVQKSFDPPLSTPAGSAASSLSPEAKDEAFRELRARALVCQKCQHLAASRRNVVFGVGDIHAPLMFVGEAPGADEDEQGEPFVGRAGQLLTRIIQTMGFSRETVFIANILKCRPDTPGQSAGNRKPTSDEMKTCLPYLLAQIDIIRPRIIVALGATAVEGLMGRVQGITRIRGQWLSFRDTPLMPTYHPAYLLRNQNLAVKRELWEDMLKVLERLGRPITEKQRSYFLRS